MPELPTIAEAALPGYAVTTWNGLLVPARTPPEVVARLNADVGRALRAPEARDYFRSQGLEVATGSAEEFRAFMQREATTWKKVIEASGARLD
jgi:tripartite-type tricarboxylate transporter receptor subunit TctC